MFRKIKNFFLRLFGKKNLLFYIANGTALPLPLNHEEEARLLKLLSCGDPLAKETLTVHNLRLVVYISKKFIGTGIDDDDLISVGTIGLIKALNSFNLDKNIKLATYASRCIENEILMHLRKVVKFKGDVSLEEPLNVDHEGNELLLSDVLGSEPDEVYKSLEKQVDDHLLCSALSKLNFRERYIMEMRFGLFGADEKTQKEIADILGISQSYISRLEKKIMERLKREMARLDF